MRANEKNHERRRFVRYRTAGNPIAVLRPGPIGPGKIARISEQAVEVDLPCANGSEPSEVFEIDILVPGFNQGILAEKIQARKISDQTIGIEGGVGSPRVLRRLLAFSRLTAEQRGRIRGFIDSYGR